MILTLLKLPASLICSLLNIPIAGGLIGFGLLLVYIFAILMVYFLFKKWAELHPEKFPWFISAPYMFLKDPVGTIKNKLNPFKKKEKFVSHPLKYKKQLNNDGGIGWVPYYGKPGRLCKEDKDCPTFQKCNEDKCVIPPRVR